MKTLPLCLAALFVTSPVLALEGKGADGGEHDVNRIEAGFELSSDAETAPELEDDVRAVELPTIVAPAFQDGRLLNYFFVSVRLVVKEGVDPWEIRGQSHYLRDAMIRLAHRESLADPDDPTVMDREKAARLWREAANRTLQHDSVIGVQFINVDSRN